MLIPLVAGVGRGRTLLSSFDDALHQCGVCNYNLLALSSVILPASRVAVQDRFVSDADEHGHRLYLVKADQRSDRPGGAVGAGIGWYQWGDGRGVCVEHETTGAPEDAVHAALADRIHASLGDLCAARGVAFDSARVGCRTCVATVAYRPTTVLVLAVYRSESWE